ncbi:MAG: class F sortase [Pseudonocardiaceae bacterium]
MIIGHVYSAANGPSVFFNLGRLKPGQQIRVGHDDQTTLSFEVDSVRSYPKNSFR